ncbi:hypothetical protein, partial [Phocaeicola sp.]|uniref:hypothetical protein n=1 Tax=Phocaeicola sp. TaxID=2773926 RepID=UPI003AB38004
HQGLGDFEEVVLLHHSGSFGFCLRELTSSELSAIASYENRKASRTFFLAENCRGITIIHLDVNGVNPVIFLSLLLDVAVLFSPDSDADFVIIHISGYGKLTNLCISQFLTNIHFRVIKVV